MLALWLRDGGIVSPPGSKIQRKLVDVNGNVVDPFDVLRMLSEEFSCFILFDLDGRERSDPDLELFQDSSEEHEIVVDVGVRRLEDAMDAAMTSAAGVICSTTLLDYEEISEITGVLENVYLGIELGRIKEEGTGVEVPGDFEYSLGSIPEDLLTKGILVMDWRGNNGSYDDGALQSIWKRFPGEKYYYNPVPRQHGTGGDDLPIMIKDISHISLENKEGLAWTP